VGHAAPALPGDAQQAGRLHRLPAALPARLPGPADPAQGAGLGAQLRRLGGARRAAVLVGAADPGADGGVGAAAALRRLVAGGVPGRRPGAALALDRRGLADRLRDRAGPRRGAGRHRAPGRGHQRAARALGPDRPHRPARRRARDRGLQDRPASQHRRRGARLDGAGGVRARRPPHAAPCVQPGGAAPPAVGHRRGVRAHRAVAGQPRPAGRGHRRRHHRGDRAHGRRGGPGRRVPRRPGRAVQLVRLPAELPDGAGRGACPGDVELPPRGRPRAL
ncbi:MAG: RecB family exonuclease, partial [uncultured Blastococcus sp.]